MAKMSKKGKDIVNEMSKAQRGSTTAAKGAGKVIDGVIHGKVSSVIEGASDFAKGVHSNIKHTAKAIKRVFTPKTNHPEWVDKFVDNPGFVNLNFGYRKSVDDNFNKLMNITETGAQRGGLDYTTMAMAQVHLCLPNDSLNTLYQAVSIIYSKIRAANSGKINSTVQDLLVYIMNVRSIRAAITQLSRAVKLTNYNDPYDADVPIPLTTLALGGCKDTSNNYRGTCYEALLEDKANFIVILNTLLRTVKAMLPINIDLFNRTEWMLGNVFLDSQQRKANFIVPTCLKFPKYTVNEDGTVTRSVAIDFSATSDQNGGTVLSTILEQIKSLISEVITTSSNLGIPGDILKTFGDGAFYDAPELSIYDELKPVFDIVFLKQFQNASIMGVSEFTNTDPVEETLNVNTGSITTKLLHDSTWQSTLKYNLPNQVRVINSYDDNVTPGEVLSMVQNVVFASADASNKFTITQVGNCFIGNILYMVSCVTNSVGKRWPIVIRYSDGRVAAYEDNAKLLNAWSLIDYSPFLSLPLGTSDNYYWAYLFDVDNYALLDRKQFDSFNQLTTLSYLKVPDDISRQSSFKYSK